MRRLWGSKDQMSRSWHYQMHWWRGCACWYDCWGFWLLSVASSANEMWRRLWLVTYKRVVTWRRPVSQLQLVCHRVWVGERNQTSTVHRQTDIRTHTVTHRHTDISKLSSADVHFPSADEIPWPYPSKLMIDFFSRTSRTLQGAT